MIRFLLPALLVLLGSCQGAYQSADTCMSECADCASGVDCTDCASEAAMDCADCEDGKACTDCEKAVQASLIAPGSDCAGSDCASQASAECAVQASADCQQSMEHCEMSKAACDGGECSMATGTQVALTIEGESCAMKAAGVCEEGEGECPMEAAGNVECAEMGTENCPMQQAAAGATEVVLTAEGECSKAAGDCASQASAECAEKASAECAEKAAAECAEKASAECAEKASAECAEKAAAGCSEKAASECEKKAASEAPAAVQTGATAEPAKEEVPPCCSSKKVDPSS